MTETRQYIGFGDVEKILVKSYKSITGGREFDIDKYGPYVDAVRCVLVPSLEKQILFFLERFVYNEEFQQPSHQGCLTRYKDSILTAYTKYNELGTSIEAMRESLTIDHLVNFLGHSLLTNSRLAKISDDLNGMGIEKNWLGYVNVLNYINEKDFWVSSSSSSSTSRRYSSICSPSNNNIFSDMNAKKGSHMVERTRGYKRPRKRAATHISRKHYKLERLAQLSERSFRVTEGLYDLLKSNWVLHDSVHAKRRLRRNCGGLRRSNFTSYGRNRRKTNWKNENLTFIIRKMNGSGTSANGNEDHGTLEVRTSSSLPCKVDQLLSKLDRVDSSLTRFHCNFIQKKFHIKLYNVCSCLNNLLSRMDVKTINSIYLICEIRTDFLNFKLKQTAASKCNSPLFSARVMTCEALHRCGIRRNGSRQKLKSQSFWAVKKANELSTRIPLSGNVLQAENIHFGNNEAISSIEISFVGCEGSAERPENVRHGLTCGPEDLKGLTLRDSLSISNVVQKLQLSPFSLEETEQSFKIRSRIQDIVRSIMICTKADSSPGREGRESISIEAVVSTSSFHGIKHGVEVHPNESESAKALNVSNVASFIESRIYSSRSKELLDCNASVNLSKSTKPKDCGRSGGSSESNKPVMPKSCLEPKEQSLKSGGSVRPNKSLKKSQASSSSRESAKLMYKNKYKICTTSEKPIRSKEFTGSIRPNRPLSKKIVESIASEISYALAKTKSNCRKITEDEDDYEIDVTVEIEDSSESSDHFTESISRHTHILPSMKSVKLGTNSKYFSYNCVKPVSQSSSSSSSTSSSESEVLMLDNYTTMNKSMISSSNRGTISAKSYNRIKHLIREKVCKKLSETDSCEPKSSKTIVSSGKYYLSIPSSKTSRVLVKREISESSSTSSDSLRPPVCKRRPQNPKTSSSDDESLCSNSSDCYLISSTPSSGAATFDKNSTYACIEDRLANRYFRDIVHDYSDETGNSPRCKDFESENSCEQFSQPVGDCGLSSDERKKRMSRYYDSEISSEENEADFSQSFATDDDARTKTIWSNDGIRRSRRCHSKREFYANYVVGRAIVQRTPRLDDYQRFVKIERSRPATGWSTCAIRSSSSRDCREIHPPRSRCRMNIRDRGDSQQQKTFVFEPLNIIEKYRKQFQNMDKSFRTKLTRYVGFCKNVKNNLQKKICLDYIREASRTSIPLKDSKTHKYNGVYFGG